MSKKNEITIHLRGCLPIPVGHRVEIIWYSETKTPLWGKKTAEKIRFPLIIDTQTGIHYGPMNLYTSTQFCTGTITLDSHELRSDIQPIDKTTGIITSCSIVPILDVHIETELKIDIE